MERQERFENIPKWEKLDKDMLANIFKKLDMVDVIMGASRVCITWFLASHNKTIWNTIKLNDFDSIVLDNPSNPHLQDLDNNNGGKHLYSLREILTEINKFSRAAPVEFFFNANTNVLEQDLAIISNGLPNIRKLALRMQKTQNLNSFTSSFSKWKNLQTLIIAKFTRDDDDLKHEFKAIAENCRNLTTIKITCTLDQELANIIVGKLPNLKSLSFRCTYVSVEAVKSLIFGLYNLKSLNLSHCIFLKRHNNGMMLAELGLSPEDKSIILSIQKLETLSCVVRSAQFV
ncbi:putative F-box protein At4g11580 [Brassica napus]|uniref:putative F-box protein At4g11580 n=1 Tax=Brassica napus TaxID=3708 RepID=UPI000BBE4FD8|nr:putative F-box protein At4g11580 [Brassica napus]XP_048601967.1 putative F-box protein At4g11580 [Brassica napus]XP_048601968.1 putative F-box protein At4g11580 [Brassica napus]XP_048601969.1 putative F-box protein At4g11580 [Brassica napus]